MSDFIKREDALNAFNRIYKVPSRNDYYNLLLKQIYDTYDQIKSVPSADVTERMRGEWIEVVRYGLNSQRAICECSHCGRSVWVYDDKIRRFKYCPNCGAQMDGDSDV